MTGVGAALALAGYVLSRTVGLPQIHDDIGNWQDPLGTAAIACELLILMAAGVHLIDGSVVPGGIRDVRGSMGTFWRGGSRIQLDRGLLSR